MKRLERQRAIMTFFRHDQVFTPDVKTCFFWIYVQTLRSRQGQHIFHQRFFHKTKAGHNAVKSSRQFFSLDLFEIRNPGMSSTRKCSKTVVLCTTLLCLMLLRQRNGSSVSTSGQENRISVDFVGRVAKRSTTN